MAATITEPSAPQLPQQPDRCDRCGARGFTRFELPSGLDLVLCGHHGREHGPQLLATGAVTHLA